MSGHRSSRPCPWDDICYHFDIEATNEVYEAVKDEAGFQRISRSQRQNSLLSQNSSKMRRDYVEAADEGRKTAFTPTLEDCKAQSHTTQGLFEKVHAEKRVNRGGSICKALGPLERWSALENLVGNSG